MLPAPTTIATSTPCSCTSATWRATAATRSGSVPNSSVPISASPESFSRMRWKAGAIDARAYSVALRRTRAGAAIQKMEYASSCMHCIYTPAIPIRNATPDPRRAIDRPLLADGEAHEAANHDVLAGRRGQLVAQLLDGLAVELRVVHLLLEQHDRLQPRVELAGDDFLPHVLGLVRGLLLVDARLRV